MLISIIATELAMPDVFKDLAIGLVIIRDIIRPASNIPI